LLDLLLARLVQAQSLPRLARVRAQPHETQAAVLAGLLARAQGTAWGRRYAYAEGLTPAAFARRVPVSSYEQLYPEIEQVLRGAPDVLWPGRPAWFAQSSGTTNARSKFIPVSPESLRQGHYRAGRDMLALSTHLYPQARLLAGLTLSLGGSHAPAPLGGPARAGDVSALIVANLPPWAEALRTPPRALALLPEWEEKIERIAQHVLRQDVRVLAGVPTWMLVLLRRVLALAGTNNLLDVWPRLGLFLHGAVAFGPYRPLFEALAPGLHCLEIYNASEGYFALQDQPNQPDLLLLLDHGIYYEFLPADQWDAPDPQAIGLRDVQIGPSYALVISTNAGLWRYAVGDTVRFTSLAPYRVRVSGRTRHFLNAFGEEVMVENAEAAVAAACRATGAAVADFTAAPVWFGPDAGSRGGHEWAVEFAGPPPPPAALAAFAEALDAALQALNSDYAAKRHRGLALAPPRLHALPPGTFGRWLAGRGQLGGQHKVPRLAPTRELLEQLLALAPAA